jgi:hypothetical protein
LCEVPSSQECVPSGERPNATVNRELIHLLTWIKCCDIRQTVTAFAVWIGYVFPTFVILSARQYVH